MILSPTLLKVKRYSDARGSLLPFEAGSPLPFALVRFFVIKDVPASATRAAHPAQCNQLILALNGTCRALVGPVEERRKFHLKTDDVGLLIPKGFWLKLDLFTPGTVLVVACDDIYRGGTKRLEDPASEPPHPTG